MDVSNDTKLANPHVISCIDNVKDMQDFPITIMQCDVIVMMCSCKWHVKENIAKSHHSDSVYQGQCTLSIADIWVDLSLLPATSQTDVLRS